MAEATISLDNNTVENQTRIEKIRALHDAYPLCGKERNALLKLPDDQIAFIVSMMSGESVPAPQLSKARWGELIELLKAHWVLPLFYSQLKKLPPEYQPPQETLALLGYYHHVSQMETLRTEYQLKEILDAFKAAGIRVLVLKGTAIAYVYYPDPALRPSSDIDLLLHPDDFLRARKMMESLGYTCGKKAFEISRKIFHEEGFTHSSKPRYKMVELHWCLYISCDVDVGLVFDRAMSIQHGNVTFETLNPVDAILYNGLHMLMHHDDDVRLSWIYDVTMMARSLPSPGGWRELQKMSMEYRAARSVQVTLAMSGLWNGLALPSGFDDLAKWPQPGKQELAALDHLYLARSELMFDKLRFQWYCANGVRGKLSMLKFFLFPPAEIMRSEFPGSPEWMMPVNFVRRWFILLGKLILFRGSARVNTK